MSTSKTAEPAKKSMPRIKEERPVRIFNDYDEKSRIVSEKIRQSRVQYVVKDLPLY